MSIPLGIAERSRTEIKPIAALDAECYVLVGLVALFAVLGLGARYLGAKVSVAAVSVLLMLTLALFLFKDTLVSRVRWQLLNQMAEGLRQRHLLYGNANTPGMVGVHDSQEFRVTYTINADGTRFTPPPPDGGQDRVAVLGCSFAFGQGVEDNQTFAAQLVLNHWTGHRLENHAVMGWGPTHALLKVEELLASEDKPALILYAMFKGILNRSYRNSTYLEGQEWGVPHFIHEGGKLVHRGLIMPSEGKAPNREDIQMEAKITTAAVLRMHRKCKAAGVAFHLLVWPSPPSENDRRMRPMLRTLRDNGVEVHDARALCRGAFYAIDQHPTAACHLQLAKAAAAIPRLRALLGYN